MLSPIDHLRCINTNKTRREVTKKITLPLPSDVAITMVPLPCPTHEHHQGSKNLSHLNAWPPTVAHMLAFEPSQRGSFLNYAFVLAM